MSGTRCSASEEPLRAFLRSAIGLLLVAPFLIWIAFIPSWNPDWGAVSAPLLNSVVQALLSTAFTMGAGFYLFRAMQGFERRRARQWVEAALLLPNLVPPLFVALSLIAWTPVFGEFPFGLGAVIFAHVLLNSGLVAVSLDRLVKSKLGGLAETAWVMGARPLEFWLRVAWPLLKADLAYLFLFVFAVCFTSFALPLLLSGERVVTLEVAIFDAIRLDGRWDQAVLLAALQTLFLFAMASVLPRPLWQQTPLRSALPYLGSKHMRGLAAVPVGVLVVGWAGGVGEALGIGFEGVLWEPVVTGFLLSLALGLSVGILLLLFFFGVAFVTPHPRFERFLNGYLAPSPAITAFGLVLLPVESETGKLLLSALALALLSLPLLYRWMIHSTLNALSRQVAVARTLGASWGAVMFDVVWPQAAPRILRACGLGALWAGGDFAISGILLGSDVTLPLVIENLLNNYRFETAQLLLPLLLFTGLLLYAAFTGAARYVAR